jgi:hypothetical protein
LSEAQLENVNTVTQLFQSGVGHDWGRSARSCSEVPQRDDIWRYDFARSGAGLLATHDPGLYPRPFRAIWPARSRDLLPRTRRNQFCQERAYVNHVVWPIWPPFVLVGRPNVPCRHGVRLASNTARVALTCACARTAVAHSHLDTLLYVHEVELQFLLLVAMIRGGWSCCVPRADHDPDQQLQQRPILHAA